jgi:hypothetical protein
MARLTGAEADAARICSYCGCLYVQAGAQKTVRGYMTDPSWRRASG